MVQGNLRHTNSSPLFHKLEDQKNSGQLERGATRMGHNRGKKIREFAKKGEELREN